MDLKDISKVGLGGCEYPKDQNKLNELISFSIEKGVNFFDFGFGYGGKENLSEEKFGEYLKENQDIREKILICDKFPLIEDILREFNFSEENPEEAFNKIFEKQLERLNTDYIDVYMIHALDDSDFMTEEKYISLFSWMIKLKEQGKIKNIGFSAHIDLYKLNYYLDLFEEKFGKEINVVMLAYNIFSGSDWIQKETGIRVWTNPGKKGFELCKKKGYTCISMMPLESGRVKEISTDKSFINWCYRFVKDNEFIDCVLTGTARKNHLEEALNGLN